MYIYFLYFIFIFISGQYIKRQKLLNDRNLSLKYTLAISCSLVLLAGLRGIDIGADTEQYQYMWERLITANNYDTSYVKEEIGYFYIQTFLKQYINYQGFLFLIAIFSIFSAGFIIYRHSKSICFSFLIFYSSIAFHTLEFSATRQCIAFGFILLAFHFMTQRKPILYVLFISLGFLFHVSSIIFLPAYWIMNIKLERKTIIYWCCLLIFSFIFSKIIFAFLNSYSRIDYSTTEVAAGGERYFILQLVITVIGFINYKTVNKDYICKISFILYSISALLWPFLNGNPALYRLQYYFDFFLCLYIPNFIYKLSSESHIKKIAVSIISFQMLYVLFFMRTIKMFYPYNFFWE